MAYHPTVIHPVPYEAHDAILGKLSWDWMGNVAPDGTADPWKKAAIGSRYLAVVSSVPTQYIKTANAQATADWRVLSGVNSRTGFLPIPLTTLRKAHGNDLGDIIYRNRLHTIHIPIVIGREDISNEIGANATTPAGGILTKDTTPNLELVNGDTDSQIRYQWAAANVDGIFFQTSLPSDLDVSEDITVRIRAEMTATTDTPVLTIESFFNEGDTKVTDTTGALAQAVANVAATIAAADIPSGARTLSFEVIPGAHGSDTIELYSIQIECYVSSTNPALAYSNGDTDSSPVLTWAAGEVTPIWFSTPLPPNFDDASVLEVHMRIKSGGSTNAPVISADTYFDEADTKIEVDSPAITAAFTEKIITIAAADFPASQFVTVELTPGSHSTDSVVMSSLWLEWTNT